MRLNIRLLLALVGYILCLTPIFAQAQVPIIVETTGQPKPKPKFKPKPKPVPPPKPAEPVFVAPKLSWKTLLKPIEGGLTYSGGALFLAGGTTLYKLDDDGRTQWAREIGEQRATAGIDDRRVFVGNEKGVLSAMTQLSGSPLFQFASESGAAIQNAPTVGGGRIYVDCSDNNIYALSAANGQLLWKFLRPDGSLSYSAPVFADGSVYVAGETTLYKLDAATGKEQWRVFVGGKSLSTPALTDKAVYIGGDGAGVSAFARDTGKLLWNFQSKSPIDWFGAPLAAGNRVYVATYQKTLYALDAVTGASRWRGALTGPSLNRPALDAKRGVIYVTCTTYKEEPSVLGFAADGAGKRWEYGLDIVTGGPLVVGDRLYVGSTNGYLYAFGL